MPGFFTRRHVLGAGGALVVTPLLGTLHVAQAAPTSPRRRRGAPLPTHTIPGLLSAFLPPNRVFDSRVNVGPLNGQKLQAGESVAVTVPAEIEDGVVAIAMILNVTVTQTEGKGYLVIRGSDLSGERPLPDTSNVNWYGPGQTVANLVFTDVGGENAVEVHNAGTGATHVIVDVQGFVPYDLPPA